MSLGRKFHRWFHRLIEYMNEILAQCKKPGVVIDTVTCYIRCSTRLSKLQLPIIPLGNLQSSLLAHATRRVLSSNEATKAVDISRLIFQRTQLMVATVLENGAR